MTEVLTEQIFLKTGDLNEIEDTNKSINYRSMTLIKQLSSKLLQTTQRTLNDNLLNNSITKLNKKNDSNDNFLAQNDCLNNSIKNTKNSVKNKIDSSNLNNKLINEKINFSINSLSELVNETQTNTMANLSNNKVNENSQNSSILNVPNLTSLNNCNKCLSKFSVFRRKHQCRICNKQFCSNCLHKNKENKNCLDCFTNEQIKNDSENIDKEKLKDDQINSSLNKESQVEKNKVNVNNQTDKPLINRKMQLVKTKIESSLNKKEETLSLNKNLSLTQPNDNLVNEKILSENNQKLNKDKQIINMNINSTIPNLELTYNSSSPSPSSSSTNSSTSNKNDFAIISVLKKQGVTKSNNKQDTIAKKVIFSDGIRPGDENIIEQQRTTILPNLLTVNTINANLMTNFKATSQIPSRITFKPFLAHSQLTYAQQGLILNNSTRNKSTTSNKRSQNSKRHLTHQKLVHVSDKTHSPTSYTLYTNTSSNTTTKQPRSINKKYVYLTNGNILVNNYSNYTNYNDFYFNNNNDFFQDEKMFTSYLLLA